MAKRRRNASSGGSSLLTAAAIAVGGYFVYEWLFATPATAATTTTTPPASTTAPITGTTSTATSTTAPATTTTAPTVSQLDTIYQKIIQLATPDPNFTGSGDGLTSSAYHFNVYLQIAAPNLSIPDPATIFGPQASNLFSAAGWWALTAPALKQANPGLSGGLGFYGGVGAAMAGLGCYEWR